MDEKSFLITINQIGVAGCEFYILYPVDLIVLYRLFAIILVAILYFSFIFVYVIIQNIKQGKMSSYLASIISSSENGVVGFDLNGKIISWNKGAEKIYGYTDGEILGKNISTLIASEKNKKTISSFGDILRGKKINSLEDIHVKKDNNLVDVSLTPSAIKDVSGVVIGFSVFVRDITKEKKLDRIIKKHTEELEKFKLAVDASSDAIVITDKDAHILYMNKTAEAMSGFYFNEVDGSYIGKLWGGHMEPSYYQKMWNTIKIEKKVYAGEFKNRRKSGEEYYVSAKLYPILDEFKEIKFYVGVESDITKIKEMERVKSEFVSVTSHQLRTPLTGIKWFSELLLKGKAGTLKPEQKDYIQQVSDSNDRMIKLVDDLLDVSHIDEMGKFKIILAKEDFSSIINETVDRQKNIAKEKGIKIKLSPKCKLKMFLSVDREKIEQALQNILSNAIKYSPEGGIISVDCNKKDGKLVCSFADKGIGIPTYQQPRVFERFFRADNVITVGSGTGLGLYIAKFIVESHDGKIWFESKENKGTTFYISLPIK